MTTETPTEAYGSWSREARDLYHRPFAQERRVYRPDYGASPEAHPARHRRLIVNDNTVASALQIVRYLQDPPARRLWRGTKVHIPPPTS